MAENIRVAAARDGKKHSSIHQIGLKYDALLLVMPDLMFVLDKGGTYIEYFADREGELVLPAEELLGKNLDETPFRVQDRRRIRKAMAAALKTGQTQTLEYEVDTVEGTGHFEARLVRLDDEHIMSIVRNITARRLLERERIEMTAKLGQDKIELEKQNTALEQVLKHLESERHAYRKELGQRVIAAVIPILNKVRQRAGPSELQEADFLQAQLKAIVADDGNDYWDRYATLTPREMELCQLLKDGLSSKEISDRLSVSLPTVHKHREQVRKKLGFQNTRVNLSSYLRLHPPTRPT